MPNVRFPSRNLVFGRTSQHFPQGASIPDEIGFGDFADRPNDPEDGSAYVADDSDKIYFSITPPNWDAAGTVIVPCQDNLISGAGFANNPSSNATANVGEGYINLTFDRNGTVTGTAMYEVANLPAGTTWDVTFSMLVTGIAGASWQAGVYLYESGSGDYVGAGFGNNTTNYICSCYSGTAYGTSSHLNGIGLVAAAPIYYRFIFNGSNVVNYVSFDGVAWIQGETSTTFPATFTPNKLGFGVSSGLATVSGTATLTSYCVSAS